MSLPSEVEKYSNSEELGLAHVKLSRVGSKTAISQLHTKSPILVQKALYPDSSMPSMAHIYLMSSAGGILQGDRLDIKIEAGENTLSRITTQAATKIYQMDKDYALQTVSISAGRNSYLEFLPYQLIPFKGSRFYQQVNIKTAKDATVVYCETITAGRTASGEKFDFDACLLRVAAHDDGGRLLFTDSCNIEPKKSRHIDVMFGGKTIWSTIYIITPKASHENIKQAIDLAIKDGSILAGCSTLPSDCGLVVRALDNSIDVISGLTSAVASIAREHATGRIA
jgi:urease accessory protein